MTSKNSFWASIKENNKRRIWLWLVAALTYVIAFPTVIAIRISQVKTNEAYLLETLGESLGRETIHNDLVNQMLGCFGVNNYVLMAVASLFAVISAIQGFGYLYHRRKIDFYMGMPVKRSRRFRVIWLNGVLIYLIPSLLGTLLGWLIAAANGTMTAAVFTESITAYGLLLCLYLGVYHLTILVVMLTGNVIITCMGTAVFFLYELAVRALLSGYKAMFYKSFVYRDDFVTPVLSPFALYITYAARHNDGLGNGFATVVYLLLFAAAAGVIAYVCYLKRPAEAAGKAMAFKLPQPFIKIFLAVPVTLLAGYVVSRAVGYDPVWGEGSVGFVAFTMMIVLVVVCCLIQVLYEFDIRGIFHKKLHILISAAAVTVIFLVFRYDALGYDTYLPKVENVASAAVITPYEYSYYGGNNYFNEDLEYVAKDKFIMDNMYLTDIGAVNKLLKKSIETFDEYENLNQLYTKEDACWYTLEVVYRMDGRRTVSRRVYADLNDPETMELLDRIQDSDEYISGAYISMAENLDRLLAAGNENNRITITYGTNIYNQKLTSKEAAELLALYKEDIKESSFSEMRESIPTGSLRINIEKRRVNYSSYVGSEIRIYPFYTKCVEYLKAKGIYMENFLNLEDVEKIQVTNYNFEIQQQEQGNLSEDVSYDAEGNIAMAVEQEYIADASEYIRNAVYDKEEDIRQICDKIYPSEWIYSGWGMDAQAEESYSVIVYFKPEKSVDGMGIANYVFLKGETPEFVRKDTVYEE
ncbi:MAG: DUF6449 domain-containing protein [Suilimivivens sp.]